MPRRRTMTEYREIDRRLQKSQSIRGIRRETGIHRTIIRKIKKQADKNAFYYKHKEHRTGQFVKLSP